jgi:hypothetical protein
MDYALPGADLIEKGLRDLREYRETVESLLVAIGAPKLRSVGINVPAHELKEPEMRLYDLLAKDHSDSAHARYNALVRRLVVFEHTAEHAVHAPPVNSHFRRLVNSIASADFPLGIYAIRTDLAHLQAAQ